MVTLSPSDAVALVRKNLDEIAPNGSAMYDPDNTYGDNASMDDIIRRNLPEAINAVNTAAPAQLLEGKSVSASNPSVSSDGVLSFSLPEGSRFLRLVAFQASDSPIVVTDVLPEASGEGHKQLNRYIRGRYDRPRLVLLQGRHTEPEFKYYSLRENTADPASAILHRFTYEAQIATFFPGTNGRQYDEVDSAAFHRALYRLAKEKFPDLIFCLQTDAPARIKDFLPACDLMEVCPFGGYSDAAIEKLKYGVPQAVKSLNGKPVIFWMGVTIPNNSCRKAEELRAAIYLHIIHGGSGTIMHMGHGRLPFERSRLWSVIRGINGEIASFYPRYRAMPLMDAKILGIKAEQEYAVSIRGNGREAVALVVSLSCGKNSMMLKPADGWKIVSGGKAGKPENWTPYEARVIRLKK